MTSPSDEELSEIAAKLDRVAELLTGFEEQIAGRRAELERRGGQHVPHHGDFCSCPPSALNRLEWWARAFREVLK